jgi:hypothetical protein
MAPAQDPFQRLPDVLLSSILSHLHDAADVARASSCCKKWRPAVWGAITSLSVHSNRSGYFKTLTEFELVVTRLVARTESLESLSIVNKFHKPLNEACVLSWIQHSKTLEYVNIVDRESANPDPDEWSLDRRLLSLSKCPSLKCVSLEYRPSDYSFEAELSRHLRLPSDAFPSLTRLDLSGIKASAGSLEALVKHCSLLEHLHLNEIGGIHDRLILTAPSLVCLRFSVFSQSSRFDPSLCVEQIQLWAPRLSTVHVAHARGLKITGGASVQSLTLNECLEHVTEVGNKSNLKELYIRDASDGGTTDRFVFYELEWRGGALWDLLFGCSALEVLELSAECLRSVDAEESDAADVVAFARQLPVLKRLVVRDSFLRYLRVPSDGRWSEVHFRGVGFPSLEHLTISSHQDFKFVTQDLQFLSLLCGRCPKLAEVVIEFGRPMYSLKEGFFHSLLVLQRKFPVVKFDFRVERESPRAHSHSPGLSHSDSRSLPSGASSDWLSD